MLRCLLLCWLFCNALEGFAQSSSSITIDSSALKIGQNYHRYGIRTYRTNIDSTIYYVEQAIPYFKQSGVSELYVKELLTYSNLLKNTGRFSDYFDSAELTLQEVKQLLGEEHQYYAVALNSLSSYYYERGNFEKAIQYSKQSVAVFQNNPQDRKKLATAYKNLANAFTISGDYEQAIAYLEKALQIRQSKAKKQPFPLVRIYNGLGWNYKLQGKIDSAYHYYMKCLDLIAIQDQISEKPSETHPTVQAYHGAAEIFLKRKEYDQAINYIRQALQHQTKEKAFRKSISHEILGRIYQEQGQLEQALEEFYQAREIAEQRIAKYNKPGIARKYLRIADAYKAMGQQDSAIINYHRGILMLDPTTTQFSLSHYPSLEALLSKWDALNLLQGKGEALWADYESKKDRELLEQAYQNYTYGIDVIRDMRQGFITQEAKNTLSENSILIYEGAIQSALEQYRWTQEEQWLKEAFVLSERNKSLLLLEAFNEQAALGMAGLPDSLLQKDKELRLEIAFYQKQLLEASEGEARTGEWKEQLFRLKQQSEALTDFFEQNYPRFYEQKYASESLDPAALQQLLGDLQEGLIEYFAGEQKIYGFALWSEGCQVFEVERSPELLAAIDQLRRSIQQAPEDNAVLQNYQDFCSSAYLLYRTVLAPALELLPPSIRSLKIIPDGQLNHIAFDLLLQEAAPAGPPDFSLDHLAYVTENYSLSYDYSATWMLKNQIKDHNYKDNFIAYAPAFPAASGQIASRSCQEGELYQLECSREEVERIHEMIGGTIRVDAAALKAAFEEEAANYRIIHMATHACADEANPLFNKIFLSDDYLSNADLYNTSLNAELVVLSACNTGTGKLVKGEGVLSLARGFVQSGCASSVVSRWSVDDCATGEIMAYFYEALEAGAAKHEALRQAKLRFLAEADQLHSHPYYWSAFVAYGDMGAMNLNSYSWWTVLIVLGLFISLLGFFGLKRR